MVNQTTIKLTGSLALPHGEAKGIAIWVNDNELPGPHNDPAHWLVDLSAESYDGQFFIHYSAKWYGEEEKQVQRLLNALSKEMAYTYLSPLEMKYD